MKNDDYFIEESLNVTDLTIFQCTNITFASTSVRIYVNNGFVNISGSEKCRISMQQLDFSKKLLPIFSQTNVTGK